MSKSVLKIQRLTKSFSTGEDRLDILRGVDFDVYDNEIVALTGASGVGKSTLLHLMGGLDKPSSGEVFFDDKPVHTFNDQQLAFYRNTVIGFVFQFHHLLPEFTALENVAMPLLIRRIQKNAAFSNAQDLINRVGLKDRKDHKPAQLSGGEQQRIALARAMISSPRVILADEPTGNLDEETAKNVFNLIRELKRQCSVSFVIATHNMTLARSADRRFHLTDGRVEEEKGPG